jgi:hypothetical protein
MRRRETNEVSERRSTLLFAVVFAGISLLTAGQVPAQTATLVPAAPPENAELPYNIPLHTWMVPEVIDLKTSFSDGLSAEFSDIAENQTSGGIRILIGAGEKQASGAAHLKAAIEAISEIDVTFGIEGISRIIPAEGALRDTLFGFVVWHETSTKNSQGLMKQFEGLVESVVSGGEAAGGLAAQLSTMDDQLNQAIADKNMDRVAELSPGIVETSTQIDALCQSVAESATELGTLIDQLSEDSGKQLMSKWSDAKQAVNECIEPAAGTADAYASVSAVLYLMIELGRLLGVASSSVNAVETAPVVDGLVYIPWTVLRDDWTLVQNLELRLFNASAVNLAQPEAMGAEGGTSGEETPPEMVQAPITGATEETKRSIRSLYPYQVEANAILAERAVTYTSMVVDRAMDHLDAFYREEAGFDPSDNERAQRRALEKADESMSENLALVSARMSAAGARQALALGDEAASLGEGHEVDALHQYENAWLFSLNAGASAERAVLVIDRE